MKVKIFSILIVCIYSLSAYSQLQTEHNNEYKPVLKGSKWGIQKDGEWVVKPNYQNIMQIGDNYLVLSKKEKNKWLLISAKGERVSSDVFESPILLTINRALVGNAKLIDDKGRILYDTGVEGILEDISKIDTIYYNGKKILKVKQSSGQTNRFGQIIFNYGIINEDGMVLVPVNYRSVYFMGRINNVLCFSVHKTEGIISTDYGIVGIDGKEIMPCNYIRELRLTRHPDLLYLNAGFERVAAYISISTKEEFVINGEHPSLSFTEEDGLVRICVDRKYSIAKGPKGTYERGRNGEEYAYFIDGHFYSNLTYVSLERALNLNNPFDK